MNRENAIIVRTELGYCGPGLPSFNLMLEGNGWGQSCGDIMKPSWEMILAVLDVAGVKKWEDLRGRPIVALRDIDFGYIVGLEDFLGKKSMRFDMNAGPAVEVSRG